MRNALINARGTKTQQEVSSDLDISQKYLSKLELGQRNPSIKLAIRITQYYNSSFENLFPDIFLQHSTP